ncbi:hypothetical protein [Streptomyces bauhiniae]|uniref:Uncharacterized protein n=1 Tax=Streptomyces bauhiniae TaxID=2340725 RepID=A0A7K3QRK0_9ACTN|nr:hypothetical protein [Streptomyces bauhiniae]NEB92400.1 hypothetical protein [Streptomyces bauhiniae]
MTRPLPPHGSYARANGSPGYRPPCKCEPCLVGRRTAKKRERVNRQLGRTSSCDATQVRTRLNQLNEVMGWEDIAKAAATSAAHLREIASGRLPRIKKTTHSKIMGIQPAPTGGQYIDATRSIRQVRALQTAGHSAEAIAAAASTNRSRILPLLNGYPRLRRSLATRIDTAYEALATRKGDSTRSRNRANREGWAPPGAWDDDTIGNPAAHPEWTGACGNDRGYWMHALQKLPMCDRCEQAHQDWLTEREHLTPAERNQARFRARVGASQREADLAHDARELIRVSGLTTEQAAERLAVTRQHLQQAMLRHPEEAAA